MRTETAGCLVISDELVQAVVDSFQSISQFQIRANICLLIVPPSLLGSPSRRASRMVWRSNFPALSRNSARGTASTLALANVGLVSGTSAALSLNSNDLVRNILRLTEGNQIKFVDTVYHVCPNGWHSVITTLIHSSCEGLSDPRLTKR